MNCRGNHFAGKILSEGKLRPPRAEEYYRTGYVVVYLCLERQPRAGIMLSVTAKNSRSPRFHCRWQYCADTDLPTVIDKVLNETKQSKFYLHGDSMGGTIGFAFLSENHSYDDKVRPRIKTFAPPL